jgi:subfamily B ATP-binding cassette protein MsbA
MIKKFASIFNYVKDFKGNLWWYALFTLLSVLFGLFSVGMLMPFLDLIFSDNMGVVPADSNKIDLKQRFYTFLQQIIETQGRIPALGLICVFIMLTVFLKNLFLYFSTYFLTPVRNSVSRKYNRALYAKILELPVGYFTNQRKGDILSRASGDVAELESAVNAAMDGLVKEPLNIAGILISLFIISPQLTLFVMIFLPLSGFMVGRIGRNLKKQTNAAQIKWGHILSHLEETLGGIRIIKAFTAETTQTKQYDKLTQDLYETKNRISRRRDLASPVSEFLGVGILCGVLWFGGRLVLMGAVLSPSEFITYIALFALVINPFKALSSAFFNVQRGAATLERINEILDAPVLVKENPKPVHLEQFTEAITFENVCFRYEDSTILHNIQLKIPKGKTIALVGSSGAGKSTLADLVPRFHDATDGNIFIDNINIKDYSLKSLRQQISIVTQEPVLFNDTIAANIAMARPEAGMEEIITAAKVANAYDFIMKKEKGFDELIGDHGSKLSGGERQRLTIARALLKNPPILILDEATSSLDTESERLVQDAINKMMQNRTSIVIAHRLSTIRHADEIIVLQKGQIAERGNHDSLMLQKGIYHKLVDMQEVR